MSRIFCKELKEDINDPENNSPCQISVEDLLEENNALITIIAEYQSKGNVDEVYQYQKILHRNLILLATLADSAKNIPVALPLYNKKENSSTPHWLVGCTDN